MREAMSKNRLAIARYIAIDKCMSSGRKYTIDEIKEQVDKVIIDLVGHPVSIYTVRKDIYDMRDRMLFDAPIKKIRQEDNKVYYSYTYPGYSIFTKNMMLGFGYNITLT